MFSEIAFKSVFFWDHIRPPAAGQKGWRDSLHERLARRLNPEPRPAMPVPEVEDMSREVLMARAFRTPQPLVLRQGARDWECVKKWSLEFFAKNFGDTRILSFESQEEISVNDLVASVESNGSATMKFHPLVDFNQSLQEDANWPWFRAREIGPSVGRVSNLFISGRGGTLLHAANVCNFFVQITGRKTWWIYPPSITKWIKPRPAAYHWVSDFLPEEWDPNTVLNRVPHLKVELEPGDILYNPPFFWHYVYTREPSIALAYKWINFRHCLRVSPLMTVAPFFSPYSPIRGFLVDRRRQAGQFRLIKMFYGKS